MRLIDADALLASLPVAWDSVVKAIEDAPTVEAAEVVRCKDCIYWGAEDGMGKAHDWRTYARCRIHHHYLEDMRL